MTTTEKIARIRELEKELNGLVSSLSGNDIEVEVNDVYSVSVSGVRRLHLNLKITRIL